MYPLGLSKISFLIQTSVRAKKLEKMYFISIATKVKLGEIH